jgi:hypothetical protein
MEIQSLSIERDARKQVLPPMSDRTTRGKEGLRRKEVKIRTMPYRTTPEIRRWDEDPSAGMLVDPSVD